MLYIINSLFKGYSALESKLLQPRNIWLQPEGSYRVCIFFTKFQYGTRLYPIAQIFYKQPQLLVFSAGYMIYTF